MNNNLKTIGGLIVGVLIGSLVVYTVPKYVDINIKHETQQEENIQRYNWNQDIKSKSNVEKAYKFINENIDFETAGTENVELQQSDDGLILVLTYQQDICDVIKEQGVDEEALLVDAENIVKDVVLPIKQMLQEQGFDCPINVVYQSTDGYIFAITQDEEILEINPVEAPIQEEFVQKEEQVEKSRKLNKRC